MARVPSKCLGLFLGSVTLGASLALVTLRVDVRVVLAAVGMVTLVLLLLRWPDVAVVITLLWLPFLGVTRRLLIAAAPWTSYDPILMIAPTVAILICLSQGAARPPWNRVSRLVLLVTVASIYGALTPAGAGIAANVAGALFVTIPLLWYFVGRTLDIRSLDRFLMMLPYVAILVAGYGMYQLLVGMPIWDQRWLADIGSSYAALNVNGVIRSFGTFQSSTEYEIFLLVGAVIALGKGLRSKGLAAAANIIIAAALWVFAFLDGSRGSIVFSVAAAALLWAYRQPTRRSLRLLTGAGVAVAAYVLLVLGHHFSVATSSSIGTIVLHQASGLARPLTGSSSTVGIHYKMMVNGVLSGVKHPLGSGLGSITLAASRFGGLSQSSEVDFANMFIATGLVGGLAYLGLIFVAVVGALKTTASSFSAYVLPALMAVLATQWLNGGLYFLSPLIWTVMGATLDNIRLRTVSWPSGTTNTNLCEGGRFGPGASGHLT